MKFHSAAIASTLSLLISHTTYPCHGFSSIPPNNPTPPSKDTQSPIFHNTNAVDDAVVEAVKASAEKMPRSFSADSNKLNGHGESEGDKNNMTPRKTNNNNIDKHRSGQQQPKQLNSRQKSISRGRDPIISLNMNLDYLAKSGQKDAASRAEEMLLRIEALHDDGYYEKPPDVCSYNSVINAYAVGGDRSPARNYYSRAGEKEMIETPHILFGASGHAERLMQRMVEKKLIPNEITYNTLLRCIAKDVTKVLQSNNNSNKKGNSQLKMQQQLLDKAESTLSKMEDLNLANTISYNTMISILSRSKIKDSARQAEACLQRMMNLYAITSDEKVQPDTCTFNSLMTAYANIGNHVPGAVERAHRTEELLSQMEDLYRSGENENVKPDVVSYSTVLNAYSKAAKWGEEECAMKAMEILSRMERLYDAGNDDVKPNKRTYTSVINAFARTGQPEKADLILSSMKRSYEAGDLSLKPDCICYTSTIDAYAKKGGEEAAERAEDLLHEMENLYNMGDNEIKPNTRTYAAVITALGRSGQPRAAEKAEQILDEMEYISSFGSKDLAPNTVLYNAVIDAYAKSKTIGKCNRAELLLERMIEESNNGNTAIRPDTITFNSVINAAARSSFGDADVRKEAYLIGLNAFKTIHSLDYCRPSSATYVLFLRMLQHLQDRVETRDYMSEKVIQLCRQQNLLNDAVLSQLRRTCSSKLFQRLVSSSGSHTEDDSK